MIAQGMKIALRLAGRFPRTLRLFCEKGAPSIIPGKEKLVQYHDKPLKVEKDNQIKIQFENGTINYSLPEQIGGTTRGRLKSLPRHEGPVHDDVHVHSLRHETVEVFH